MELVVALALSALVLAGLQSVLLMAFKAVPDKTQTVTPIEQARAMDRLRADLLCATVIRSAASRALEFSVPDRDGDGAEDTITYSWSGNAGATLLRSFNGGPPEALTGAVAQMKFAYDTYTESWVQPATKSPETILASWTSTSNLDVQVIEEGAAIAQCVPVSLPAGASGYTPTAVELSMSTDGKDDGVTSVGLKSVTGRRPGSAWLATGGMVEERTLSSNPAWVRVDLPACPELSAGESVCVVATGVANVRTCGVEFQKSGAPVSSGSMMSSSDGGGSWAAVSNACLRYRLYGTYSTPSPAITRTRATAVRVALTLEGSSTQAVMTAALLNRPEVSP